MHMDMYTNEPFIYIYFRSEKTETYRAFDKPLSHTLIVVVVGGGEVESVLRVSVPRWLPLGNGGVTRTAFLYIRHVRVKFVLFVGMMIRSL